LNNGVSIKIRRAGMYKKRETKVNRFNDRTGRLVGQMRQVNKMGPGGIKAFKKTNKVRPSELIKGNVTLREKVRFGSTFNPVSRIDKGKGKIEE
jgi:hypothetical protein